ncbi:MAG TPA: ABC transporter permease [Gemmatimonadaceae bacterium]|nr:ABC transporter permease [Gemmatimonadaceae bacterium]
MTRTERWAGGLLAAMVIGALVVPAVARQDPLAIDDVLSARLVGPFSTDDAGRFHLLGTDRFGRDLFVRMMLAGRLSLAIGVVGSAMAGLIGVSIGAAAGWWRGAFDRLAMSASDAMLAIPRLILLLLCAALWRPGTTTVVVVLAATGWMGVARLIRAEVIGARSQAWADAAQAVGTTPLRVLVRHVLPNALGPAIVATTLGVGNAILLESGLAFLGLGVQPPQPSWGNMIAGGRDLIVTAPWVAIAPGVALILTVLGCTLLGDAWRDRLAGEVPTTLADRA